MPSDSKRWIALFVILILVTIVASILAAVFFVDERKGDLIRFTSYDLITPFTVFFILAWFSTWGAIWIWRRSNRRHLGKLIATSLLGFLIVIAGYYMGSRVLRTIAESNELITAPYYLPIQNPYDRNETMSLIVLHETPSLIAQETSVVTKITLKVNETYRGDNLVKVPPENFTVVFEGSFCNVDFDNPSPNPNYEIGFSCTRDLVRSTDNLTYTGSASPKYTSEGSYDVLLTTGKDANANFTTTNADFIKIRPVESKIALDLEKLGVYSTILSIVVAIAAAIIALIWTGRAEFWNKDNSQNSGASNHSH